jgi:hypothetical protein
VSSPGLADVVHVLMRPEPVLRERLGRQHGLTDILMLVLPPAAIGPVAVALRSVLLDLPTTALVLGLSSYALQIGTWLIVGLTVPSLARQFNATLTDRQGLLLLALASMPLWLAGAFYLVPHTLGFFFYWSRLLVASVALYGLYIVYRGLGIVEVDKSARLPLLMAMSGAYVAVYLVLFTLLGLSSHLVLYLLSGGA